MAHGRVVIESKDLEHNYKFARDVKGADIETHGKVIVESKDPKYNYKFARDIKDSDVLAHIHVIDEYNCFDWCSDMLQVSRLLNMPFRS